jgi:hypothetical protein
MGVFAASLPFLLGLSLVRFSVSNQTTCCLSIQAYQERIWLIRSYYFTFNRIRSFIAFPSDFAFTIEDYYTTITYYIFFVCLLK